MSTSTRSSSKTVLNVNFDAIDKILHGNFKSMLSTIETKILSTMYFKNELSSVNELHYNSDENNDPNFNKLSINQLIFNSDKVCHMSACFIWASTSVVRGVGRPRIYGTVDHWNNDFSRVLSAVRIPLFNSMTLIDLYVYSW